MHSGRSARGRGAALTAFLVVLSCGIGQRAPAGDPVSRPNIVLVVWDTCRGDRVAVNGYSLPTSPRLAEVAADGITFRQCFTPSPWTPPAHASLFTGLLPSRHGLMENRGDRVRQGLPLLAATLAKAGYETVAAPANPLLGGTGLLEGFHTVLPSTPGANRDLGATVAARLESWARSRRGMPAPSLPPESADLAAVHGDAADGPWPPGGPGVTTIEALDHNLGLRTVGEARRRLLSLAYDGGIHAADRTTGRILDLLRADGILDDALLAVTADHGECLGEHGQLEHRMSMQDAVLRVPLVLRWPRRLPAGRVEDAQVRLQDLYRTILDAAGAPAPAGAGLDSVSLLAPSIAPRAAVAQLQSTITMIPPLASRFPDLPAEFLRPFHRSVLLYREASTGPSRRKLILSSTGGPDAPGTADRAEIYDLAEDPGEDRDLLEGAPGPGLREEESRLRSLAREAIR